jgi:hypothetical protein
MDVNAYPKYKFSHTPTTGCPFVYEGYLRLGERELLLNLAPRSLIRSPAHGVPFLMVLLCLVDPSRIRKLGSPSPNRTLGIQILMTTPRIQRTTCLRVMQVLDNGVRLSHSMRMEICERLRAEDVVNLLRKVQPRKTLN